MVNNSKYLTPVVITVSLIIMIFINLRLIRTPMLLTYLIFSVVMSIKAHHSKSKKQLLNLEKKKFAIYIATVSLMSCMPEKWDMTLSIGNLANGIIFSLSVILTIIYYLKFIKGKVDKNGQLISKSKN